MATLTSKDVTREKGKVPCNGAQPIAGNYYIFRPLMPKHMN